SLTHGERRILGMRPSRDDENAIARRARWVDHDRAFELAVVRRTEADPVAGRTAPVEVRARCRGAEPHFALRARRDVDRVAVRASVVQPSHKHRLCQPVAQCDADFSAYRDADQWAGYLELLAALTERRKDDVRSVHTLRKPARGRRIDLYGEDAVLELAGGVAIVVRSHARGGVRCES